MITDRKTPAQKAAATKAAKKQAARKRTVARMVAYHENLTNTARHHLYESMQEIKSEYESTINAALDDAKTAASESLHNVAEKFGWSLVQEGAVDPYMRIDTTTVAETLLDAVQFDEEDEFKKLEAYVDSVNALYPE